MSELPFQAVCIPVTPYQQNCTLVWCPETMKGAVIDPGGEVDRLSAAIAKHKVAVEQILITHGHLDHASGAAALSRATGAKIVGPHADDEFLLSTLDSNRNVPGFDAAEPCTPERWLKDGDTVEFGQVTFEVLHTPGHTPGHVVYYCRAAQFVFVGDVLFKGSIGRTDFARSDQQALLVSISSKLWPLGDEVRFMPGHGPMSSIGFERRTNPFFSDYL